MLWLTLYACPLPPVATNKEVSPGTEPINQSSSRVSAYLTVVTEYEKYPLFNDRCAYQHTRVVTKGFELARAG